jgi:predicted transcriptional regulator
MDTHQIGLFSTREEEIIEMLSRAGVKLNQARVLVFLFGYTDQTSRDIERGTSLRQPEVSIAINCLIYQGWAEVSSLITENKGRPVKLYRLSASIDTILDDIKAEKEEEYKVRLELIENVRRLIHEPA